MERLDRLETECATPPPRRGFQQRQTPGTPRREKPTPKKPIVCHKHVDSRATSPEGVQFTVLSRRETRNPRREGPRVRG